MQLFPGNSNIEGIDTINACYGGTNALFNAVNWIESSSWDGRDAIVVCGDIAVYAEGAARPTGGAGSVAMLVGPDAVLELGKIKGSYFEHVYDFFKPDLRSEYPVVEGRYSLECYTRALDGCYEAYRRREEVLRRQREHDEAAEGIRENGWKVNGTNGVNGVHEINGASGTNGVNGSNGFHKTNRASGPNGADGVYETNGLNSVDGINGAGNTNGIHKSNGINGINGDNSTPTTTVPLLITDRFSYMAFHSPTSKLVTKSYARLSYADYLTSPTHPTFCALDPSLTSIPYTESLIDRRVEKTFLSLTSSDFATHVKPAMTCPTMCGNMYTASLYSGLCSLLSNVEPETLKAKTVGMYSYGSGMASTLFSVRVIGDTAEMREKMNLHERLGKRVVTSPEGFDEVSSPCLVWRVGSGGLVGRAGQLA
jgi:hydroxymethylglutaryl-CoA synthase